MFRSKRREIVTPQSEHARIARHIALWLSFETEGAAEFSVFAGWPGGRRTIDVQVNAGGSVLISPWPLGVPELRGFAIGYRTAGYPERSEPVIVPYHVRAVRH